MAQQDVDEMLQNQGVNPDEVRDTDAEDLKQGNQDGGSDEGMGEEGDMNGGAGDDAPEENTGDEQA